MRHWGSSQIRCCWIPILLTPNTGLFISPSGTSELQCAPTKKDRAERSTSIGRESLKVFFFVLGALAYLQVPPLGGSRDEKWRAQWIRKRCVLEFAKTESIVTVQRRFRTMYRTEPPKDKTIREWYMKFQQSGCLCAAKRRGRPGPSAQTVELVRQTFVRSPQNSTYRATVR